jgi:hypothetical protein
MSRHKYRSGGGKRLLSGGKTKISADVRLG